jgi:hypothetical protein
MGLFTNLVKSGSEQALSRLGSATSSMIHWFGRMNWLNRLSSVRSFVP